MIDDEKEALSGFTRNMNQFNYIQPWSKEISTFLRLNDDQ